MERTVITGIGVVSCVGEGKETFWKSVIEGKSGISAVTLFDTSRYRTKFGGEIKHTNSPYRALEFLFTACKEAICDAKIDLKEPKVGIIIGTAHGELIAWENYYDAICTQDKTKAEKFSNHFPIWRLANKLSKELEISGLTMTIPTACTASTIACGIAVNKIRRKEVDVVIVGGVDVLSQFIFAGFDSLRALSPTVCKPFDKERDGLILGEGSCVLIIESLSHAIKRDAKIYAEIVGFGTYNDAVHLSAPDRSGKGATLSLNAALKDVKIKPEDISYINAHGTGTLYNDRMECVAIKKVFGDYAFKIPISSIKPVIGHTSGASGAIEVALCALCIKYNTIPPTLNFREPMPDFEFDFVPNRFREIEVKMALSMNSAFGGSNACIILKEV